MAELVIRGRCRSLVRNTLEGALTVCFPIWGIGMPLASIAMIIWMIGSYQSGQAEPIPMAAAIFAMLLLTSTACLFAKKFLAQDEMQIDQQGIKFPFFFGNSLLSRRYVAWSDVAAISAIDSLRGVKQSRVCISTKRGSPFKMDVGVVEEAFVEQFLLAANMWAPAACDASLASLQNDLRLGASEQSTASFTALWEEELGRRFCPSAYIALEPGRSLRNNTLKVVSHLASGGLSSLYLCQLDGQKLVVLKEAAVPEDSSEAVREKAAELFEREAALLMKLDHPNIVHVVDYFVENGRNYMLLEFVNGQDLRQHVAQNGALSESQVLEIAITVAGAIKHLHEKEKPILHRDLTPDNIVLRNDGQVVIVDFGAANEFIGNATGTFVGKHAYIAPEQFRGKATVQSDIYAFGCTLHYLLTGVEPEALCPSAPRDLLPSVSEEMSDFVKCCTQLEASDRYQSMAQIIPVLKGMSAQCTVL